MCFCGFVVTVQACSTYHGINFGLQIPLRVILGYHSIPQVAVGTVLGGVSAYCWYTLGQLAILPILEADSSSRQILAATTAAALGCYMVAAFRSN